MRLRKIFGLLLLLALTSLTAATGVSAASNSCPNGDCYDNCGPCGGELYFCNRHGYPVCACWWC